MFCDNNLPNVRHIEFPRATLVKELSPREIKQRENQREDIAEDANENIVPLENVTVKFRISETQIIAQVYPNRLNLGDVKKDIARKFEVEPLLLCLKQCGKELSDECLLLETDSDEFGIHEFLLEVVKRSSESDENGDKLPKLDLNVYYDKYRLPDFITVHIPAEDTEDCVAKNIVVEIQNKAIVKPFLCGYRDKLTGIEYLDAFSQTGPYFDKWKHRRYVSRDTQTFEHKEKIIDTMHDQSSQCFLDGNNVRFVSAATDFTILPRKYQTYAQKMRIENKLEKIKLIQRNWRRVLILRYMKNAAREYRRLVANRLADEAKFKESAEKRMQRQERVKQFPRTKDDFDLLYAEVQKWKMAEMKRIGRMYEGAARIAEVNILLDKEIQLLNGVERQRNLVFEAMQDFRDEQLLTKMGTPIKWIGYKDHVVHLDLLRTQRVRFLGEIFKDLRRTLPKAERLELLAKVKEIIVKECEFPEFPELFDLFEREKNLLLYTQSCDVDILRKRQNILFMELIKFSKDKKPEKVGKRLCVVCKVVKPYEQFAVRTRQNMVDTCKKCYYLSVASMEKTIYYSILRAIQRDERKKRCNASFAFVMQVDDIRHILEKIWHGHSILSKNEDLSCLRLPRWNKSDDWSPWNCICLTESEARDHYLVEDLAKVYDQKMILEIGNRHMLARNAFHKLAAVSTEFVETGQWWRVGMNKQRTAPKLQLIEGGGVGGQHSTKPLKDLKQVKC